MRGSGRSVNRRDRANARLALERPTRIGVPAIRCLELAMFSACGRITLDRSPLDGMQRCGDPRRRRLAPERANRHQIVDDFR
jgi:hypothetical protein